MSRRSCLCLAAIVSLLAGSISAGGGTPRSSRPASSSTISPLPHRFTSGRPASPCCPMGIIWPSTMSSGPSPPRIPWPSRRSFAPSIAGSRGSESPRWRACIGPASLSTRSDAYLIGTSKNHGFVVISRSTDEGVTWTVPKDKRLGASPGRREVPLCAGPGRGS